MICGHITSRSNQWVKLVRALGTNRRRRYEEKAFICDGVKLLFEAINCGMKIRLIFASILKDAARAKTRIPGERTATRVSI